MPATSSRLAAIRDLNKSIVACPHCDELYQRPSIDDDQQVRCERCHGVILTKKSQSAEKLLAYMIASLVLYAVAVSFPFLEMSKAGLFNQISLVTAVRVLWTSDMFGLAALVALLILVIPLVRIVLLLIAAVIVRAGLRTGRRHALVIRMAQTAQPWSMAEIFMIGVTVSLVKVGKLATISTGPAFWALASLMIVMAMGSSAVCRSTLWHYVRQGS